MRKNIDIHDDFLTTDKNDYRSVSVSTLVVGIAKMGDAKALGRIFLKHSFYLFAPHCCQLP